MTPAISPRWPAIALSILVGTAMAQPASPEADEPWQDDWPDSAWQSSSPWQPLTGFGELAWGARTTSHDPTGRHQTLQEARVRLESGYQRQAMALVVKADALYDEVLQRWQWQWRQASLSGNWGQDLEFKLGRQVLTWGTGDYVFLNDLFAKDWQAFFSGRDDQYLKAPAEALKTTWYPTVRLPWAPDIALELGLDLIYQWQFEADRYLTGERFSLYSPQAGAIIVPRPPQSAPIPHQDTWSARLFLNHHQVEYAAYAHRGYTGTPTGQNDIGRPAFARLNAIGASIRLPWGRGLFNSELARHQSVDDPHGTDPRVPNSQWRWLVGYEQEIAARLTLSGQYYLEQTRHFSRQSSAQRRQSHRRRQLWTLRLNYRLWQDKLTMGFFGFYSPSDRDHYLRPTISYRHDDHWQLTAGANLFGGRHPYSFFGQLDHNDNAYLRINYFF